MPFSPEDLTALAYMARDAAANRDGGVSNSEYQSNELNAFACMILDKENSQVAEKPVDNMQVARDIYTRVSSLLHKPQAVNAVYNGKFRDGTRSEEQIFEEAFKVGYYTPNERTVYAETQMSLNNEIDTCLERGESDRAIMLSAKSAEVAESMMNTSLPVIVGGLKDGSISMDFANKSDAEIVEALINSDNTKEMQIQHDFIPVMKDAYLTIAHANSESADETSMEQE